MFSVLMTASNLIKKIKDGEFSIVNNFYRTTRYFCSSLDQLVSAGGSVGRRILRGTQKDKNWARIGYGGSLVLGGLSAISYYYVKDPEAAKFFLHGSYTLAGVATVHAYIMGRKSGKKS